MLSFDMMYTCYIVFHLILFSVYFHIITFVPYQNSFTLWNLAYKLVVLAFYCCCFSILKKA